MHVIARIVREKDEPVFHLDWERRMFELFFAALAGGYCNVDAFSHAIERIPPAEYVTSNYYEHQLHALETPLVPKRMLTEEELDARQAALAKERQSRRQRRGSQDEAGRTHASASVPAQQARR